MSHLPERYIQLGLRLGRHVVGLVDAYYGPQRLADDAAAEALRDPVALVVDAEALMSEVAESTELESGRRLWLADQVRGLATYARVLAGEPMSYLDEVEGCYGVGHTMGSESDYAAAHSALAELLPGSGRVQERYERWREEHAVPSDRIAGALSMVTPLLREPTAALVALPPDESIEIEPTSDEPWWAFNYYLGRRKSRVVVNVDMVATPADIVHLAAHEVYPGHHTERAVKEQLHLDERGWIEESIQLVPTPQALVSEGIAETGPELVLDADLVERLEGAFAEHGFSGALERGLAIEQAREPLRQVSVDAALLVHTEGASTDDAQAYIERWALMDPKRAAQAVRFVIDPTWRAYAITYSAGRELCRAYVAGDPSRFRHLLTEQIRVGELVAP